MPVLPAVPSTMTPPGPQQALLLGVADDGQRRAVLHRCRRVEELALAQDLAAGRLGRALQAHERRVADEIDEAGSDVHAVPVNSLFRSPCYIWRVRLASAGWPWGDRGTAREPG